MTKKEIEEKVDEGSRIVSKYISEFGRLLKGEPSQIRENEFREWLRSTLTLATDMTKGKDDSVPFRSIQMAFDEGFVAGARIAVKDRWSEGSLTKKGEEKKSVRGAKDIIDEYQHKAFLHADNVANFNTLAKVVPLHMVDTLISKAVLESFTSLTPTIPDKQTDITSDK